MLVRFALGLLFALCLVPMAYGCQPVAQGDSEAIEQNQEKQGDDQRAVSAGESRSPEFSPHPIIRSLAELRRAQQTLGKLDYEVDLFAQLTFAAQYWDVFYIQDGSVPSMVRCTDAVTAKLSKQHVGKWLRIRGLVYAEQTDINLIALDLLPVPPATTESPLRPMPVSSLHAVRSIARDAYIEVECILHEMLDQGKCSTVAASIGDEKVELHLQSELTEQQYGAIAEKPLASVRGTLSPKSIETVEGNYSIRMMDYGQLQIVADSSSSSQEGSQMRRPEVEVEGQVLFSDSQSEILIGTAQGGQRVVTQFASILKPGFNIAISGRYDRMLQSRNILSVQSRLLQERPLEPPVEVRFSDLLGQQQLLPPRVILEAQVIDQQSTGNLRNYTLLSGSHRFVAVVNESTAAPRLKYRTNDRIRLVGSPYRELVPPAKGFSPLKLYVVGPDAVEFISAPYQLSMTHVAWGGSTAALLVTLVFVWNWMLRDQVSLRTKRLNQISSHLRMSFEAVSEAVLINNATGEVAACNRQFARLFDEMPQEGQPVFAILNNLREKLSDRSAIDTLLTSLTSHVAEPVTVTLQLVDPPRTVQAFFSAIVDGDGIYHGHLWTFSDITDKLRLEDELIQAQKMEAVGQLSGGIAHDFNNLLTVIRSNLTLLKTNDTRDTQHECLHAAETAVVRAAELTQQLLDFSRRSRLDFQVVNLNELVVRVSSLLRRSFDRTIDLQTNLAASPLLARVDVNRFEQVLINICINARDSIKGRGGQIVLSVSPAVRSDLADRESNASPPFAQIEIRDNGCGMSPEIQRRIFEPFFTTKKPGEGTGLGLSMAHGVIQQFGGTIHCQSTPEVGSIFRIVLPTTDDIMEPAPLLSPALPSSRTSLRVLLVDDEVLIRRSGQAILKALGHVPSVAANGREALDLLETQEFDAVLLDLTMPVMSGKEAFLEIRQRWPTLPVAISTGYFIDPHTWLDPQSGQPPFLLQKPYAVNDLAVFLQG